MIIQTERREKKKNEKMREPQTPTTTTETNEEKRLCNEADIPKNMTTFLGEEQRARRRSTRGRRSTSKRARGEKKNLLKNLSPQAASFRPLE